MKLLELFPDQMNLMAMRFLDYKVIDDKELAARVLDEIFRFTFNSSEYGEMYTLRVRYEKDYDFMPSSWANITISEMILYEESGSSFYRDGAVSAYEKAMASLPDYGLPHAAKLMIHMIDYIRKEEIEVKESEKNKAKRLLETINTGRTITAYETYNYLLELENSEVFQKYVTKLLELFPDQMSVMANRYQESLDILNK